MRKTILIIDDEIGICTSLKFALNSEYNVFTATTKQEALRVLSREEVNL